MLSRLRNYLHSRLELQSSDSDDELFKNTMLLAITVLAATAYLFYAVFFGFVCYPLTIGYLTGVVVFIMSLLLLAKKHTQTASILVAVMVTLNTVFAVHTVGAESFMIIYQYMVLLFILILPFNNKALGIASMAAMPLIIVGTHVYGTYSAPVYDIGSINAPLSIVNISMVTVGLLALMLLQQAIRLTIDRYRAEQLVELQAQAYIDPLTQLYNRRYADIYLDTRDTAGIRKAFVAVADIDDFKIINDTHGHDKGDVVLKIIAKILKDNTAARNPVFRWGGEEFLVVLYDMNVHEAVEHVEKLRKLIYDTPMTVGGLTLRVSVTVGLAELDPIGFDGSFAVADKNMYYGKQHGKNQVVYNRHQE